MSTNPFPWEDEPEPAGSVPWEDEPEQQAAPSPRPGPPPAPLPEASYGFLGALREVPGVLADYGIGAAKGVGRLARGVVQADPFKPNAALNFDPFRAQKAAEIDKLLGLKAKGGVQELGGAIPYLAANPQGAVGNAALAGAGAMLETQDPIEALKSSALGGAAGLLVPAAKKVGGKLWAGAVNQYEKALNPTTRAAKVDTSRIVPELLKRRVSGSLDDLIQMGTQKSEEFGQKLSGAYSNATKTVNAAQIADDLEKLKSPFMELSGVGGKRNVKVPGFSGLTPIAPNTPIVMDDAAVAKIDEIQSKLREFGDSVPPDRLWKYRQVLDRIVKATGGFTKELSKESAGEISRGARQAVQGELTKAVPNVKNLNAEYRLWESLQDVASETGLRKTGQQGLPGMLARGAGAVTGGVVGQLVGGGPYAAAAGAMAGSQATKKIADLMANPRWRTTSAVRKAKMADFLQRGETQKALNYLTRTLTSTAASSGSPTR